MKSVYRRRGLILLAFCVATGWGCGKSPKLVPVRGVVVNGNQPVARATISFAADVTQPGRALDAYGATDAQGQFTLQTVSRGRGAPAGRYKVVITTDGPSRALIPDSCTALSTTPVHVDVPEGGTQNLKLDLSKY
jgi:hypothetical protein